MSGALLQSAATGYKGRDAMIRNGAAAVLLPYRADAGELFAWVEARARGRTTAQIRDDAASAKAREGVALTAAVLGFARDGELTERGRELALADAPARRAILHRAMLSFPPYAELLAALHERGAARVESGWIEAWWATHGWGGSQSNRQEGIAVLGRLAEHVGLGRYVQGRRGHPTRIEWDLAALAPPPSPASLSSLPAEAEAPDGLSSPEPPLPAPAAVQTRSHEHHAAAVEAEVNRVRVALEGGRSAWLEVPTRLSRGEKRRLIELLDLLVADD